MTMQYDNLEDKLSQLVEYTKDSGKIDLSLYTEYISLKIFAINRFSCEKE